MTTATFNRFDPIEYAKQLRSVGVSQEQADIQAQTIERIIVDVLQQSKQESKELYENKELATKGDVLRIEKEIEILRGEFKNDIKSLEIKLMLLYGGGFLILLGVLAKGFHWL